jgi:hypothetical protein
VRSHLSSLHHSRGDRHARVGGRLSERLGVSDPLRHARGSHAVEGGVRSLNPQA